MNTVTSIAELRAELDAARAAGLGVGVVPTMGALHEGHLSLIDRSVAECDLTVVTVFVNPTQFRPGEDLDAYPRRLADDTALASERGADLLFVPAVEEIYPPGFATSVAVRGITERLCGDATRRGHEHFDGVTTVVAKLFNIVQPDRAYFGQKDAQQVAAIRRMVADLNFRVRIETCPTVREADGLALSSRNAYLSADQRERATALVDALRATQSELSDGVRDGATLTQSALRRLADRLAPDDTVEYFEIVDPCSLETVESVDRPALAVVAARVGSTRLIDNFPLEPKTDRPSAIPTTNPIPQGAAI
ncbi:MAG: pantoate--beta-alanine ligase [Actinobacteria bacterium]|nr:pantoate--beta-alanine ligase [Actinomycetota bacterium]